MIDREEFGDYAIERVGLVWKVFYHGTWFAICNDIENARKFAADCQAGRKYTIRPHKPLASTK